MKKIDTKNIEDVFALTPMQEGMLFHYLKDPEGDKYFEQLGLELIIAIDIEIFKQAWNFVIATNEVLRVVFRWEKMNEPVQMVMKENRLEPRYFDLSVGYADGDKKQQRLAEVKEKDRREKFDLRQTPFRVTLCKLGNDCYEMIISHHHILYDGWSNGILLKEFFNAYHELSRGNIPAPVRKTGFKEFVKFTMDQARDQREQGEFWKGYLKNFEGPTELAIKNKGIEKNHEATYWQFHVPANINSKLKWLVREYKLTPAVVFYTVWGLLLQGYNDCEDVIFGATVSGRTPAFKGIEDMVGLFINTLPLRVQSQAEKKRTDLLFEIQQDFHRREEFGSTPLVQVKEYSGIDPHQELFDTLMVVENYPLDPLLKNGQMGPQVLSHSQSAMTHYDLTAAVTEGEETDVIISYPAALFDHDMIERMAGHFICILEAMVTNPEKKLRDIDCLTLIEKRQLLAEFNNTNTDFPDNKTIPELFTDQVEKTPDHVALIARETHEKFSICLTYRELNEKTTHLAGLLIEKGVKPDSIIAVMLERSVEMVVAILGILKAGGAYLPVDPEYPHERIGYMLEDSNAKLLLYNSEIQNPKLHSNNQNHYFGVALILNLKNLNFELVCIRDFVPCASNFNSSHLAYIIYTSGTTGRPKGVMVEHRNVIRLVKNTDYVEFRESDHILQTGALEFDASTFEIWGALLNGLMLFLVKKELVLSPKELRKAVEKYDISTMWLTSSLFNRLVDADIEIFAPLRNLLVGGEALSLVHINKLRAKFDHMNIINGYGPTENTTFSTTYRINKEYEDSIPIGRPIANSVAYIVDRWHRFQPVGAAGELYVGGHGVARGYLNNPELTAERFIIPSAAGNHYSLLTTHHSPLYKTGDLVRWLKTGNIEFLGRIDNQVKIRGFRIELAEIEKWLSDHRDIKEAVVIDRLVNEEKCLCAYIVVQKEKNIDISELRQYLAKIMPDYMIPAYFGVIDRLPLTANGKVDRNALPNPVIKSSEQFVAYRDGTEELLAEIWSHILGIEKEKIGIDDNFFACGGHSLKAMQLAGKIHKHFDVKIPVTAIFDNPTIRVLAEYIETKSPVSKVGDFETLEAAEKRDYYELSAGQQNIYLIQQMHPQSTAFHISSAIEPAGDANPVKIREIFEKMILRHESLRTSFIQVEGKPYQKIHDHVEFEIEILGNQDQKVEIAAFIRPFDLSRAPLVRVGLLKTRDGKSILLIDIHHIIADGTSVDILTGEFQAFQSGRQLPLPAIRYKDFCLWQDRLFKREEMKEHEKYWLELLKGQLPLLHMPTDYQRTGQNLDGDSIDYTLGQELTREVRQYLHETGATLYMLLLTVFNILFFRYTGQEDIIIGSPFAGRDHADLEGVVGLLIGALPMRNFPREYKTFSRFLEEVKKSTLQAYEHRWYPYGEILRKVDYTKQAGRTPISDISLIVQNTETGARDRVHRLNRLKFYEELFPRTSKVDMTLVVEEKEKDIFLSLEYRTGLFKRETMARLAGHLVNILKNGIADPGAYLSHIEMMSIGEKQQIAGTVEKFYPLSHAQKRIYYTEKRYFGSPVANLGTTFRYAETLDMELLETAINRVIEKNDGLRLQIVESPFEKEPLQYVAPYKRQLIDFIDFSNSGNDNECSARGWLNAKSAAPFDSLNDHLYYFARLRFNEKETGYYLKNHHIIADGWAICVLLAGQIDHIYKELAAGKVESNDAYPSYLDYLSDEKGYLDSDQVEKDKAYWRNLLLPLPPAVHLSTRESNAFDVKTGIRKFIFPSPLLQDVYTYTRSPGTKTSIYKLLFSVFSIYIARTSDLDDFVIAGASHNRVDDHQKQTFGMFAGTIPIRVKVPGDQCFHAFVEKNGNLINTIIKNHQRFPFDVLALQLGEETGVDLNYLLDINFISVGDNQADRYQIDSYLSGYDPNPLTIYLFHKPGRNILELEWNYRETLFTSAEISRMHNSMMVILEDALRHPDKKIAELEIVGPEEKRQILEKFNDNDLPFLYPSDLLLHELFSQQVEKVSTRVAVLGTETRHHVSYRQVDEQTDNLAFLLQARGIVPGDIVAVMMEPSVERGIALLGILKSGAAYLPVDPLCPQERLDYMLKDSNVKILINKSEIRIGHSGASSSFVLNFENLNFDIASNFELRAANLIPTNLSYIIYTSGSTGRPKGVAASHRNVLAYLTAFANEFHLNESDIVIQQASYTFDAFVEEMYPVLLKGGKLAVPSRETVKDIHLLAEFIARYKVSMITCSPLLLAQLNNLDSHESLNSIHTFISGGDVLHGHFIEKLLRIGNVYNTYGPTESTVCITYYRCSQVIMGKVPIGKPIANYKAYILDRNLRPVPQGIPGELCVAGPGVAQGYLNNPELTAEKFIIHHSKFYKTGDLARWLEDGNIEFLGRKDQQVKIRGFRIELEEIESHLRRHEEIRDAVVIAVGEESADKFLCAYIVSDKPWEAAALETYLAEELPDYMIPRNFTPIERIPVTTNGKVDRKTLPPPGKVGTGVSYKAPRNNIEEKLVAIWADVLAKNTSPAIGIDDDFFKLGGHSLNAAMVISKIHKILNVKIPLVDLFHQSTIRQLAEVIRASAQNRLSAVAAVEEKDYYTLSSAQERLYILQQMEPTNTTYNIPHMLKLEGVIDNEKLTQVFKELIRRHESFRTSFVTVADEPVQRVHREVDFAVEYLEGKADKIHHFIRAFDLAKAPLLRVGLVKLAEQEHILILDMHHIIADGTSMGILTAEAMSLYSNEKLPALGVRYRDYSAWQHTWKKSPSFKEQETFWRWQFEGEIPVLNLPSDRPRPKVQHFEGRSVFFELEKDITSALHRFDLREGVTLFMTLLAAFNVFLYKLGNSEDIVVGSPIEGRRHTDLQHIIGMFVNTLALRNYPAGEKSFTVFLAELKKRTISAFENQDFPFEDLVVRLDVTRDLSRNPLFDIMFVLQNMESPAIHLPGLTMTSSPFESNSSKFDLILSAVEREGKLLLSFEYSTVLFAEETVLRFIQYFKNIISAIIETPDRGIAEIEIMTGEEKRILLHDFNDTVTPYRQDRTIHELFAEQVEQAPDHIAIIARETHETHEISPVLPVQPVRVVRPIYLSYRELDNQSTRLAGILIEKGVLADTIIGIMIERSLEMMIGIYGILKAGGAYLPIDPTYPPERIDYMLKDSAAIGFINKSEIRNSKFETNPNFVLRASNLSSSNLAYLIYTSGTTGKPKGAAIEHHSLVNRLSWMQKQYPLNENDIILHKTPFTFDVSVWEIFWWGIVGAGVCLLAPGGEKDPQQLLAAIAQNRVTVMHFVPSMLRAFLEYIEEAGITGRLSSLKQVVASGEALTVPLVKRFNEVLNKEKNIRLANLYGPTEATIDVSYYDCPTDQELDRIPIGKPIANINLYIFSKDRQLQPVGVPGELGIAGVGLARGYLNRPELTAEKFFNFHHSSFTIHHSLLYRTGDLARWLKDGNIEYLGRIDQQVKVRGFRIELEEIERRLEHHKQIKGAVVTVEADGKGDNLLCAYIVSNTGEELNAGVIKEYLSHRLPAYMIPAIFKQLDRIPLTPNGKVDRKRLPALGARLDGGRKVQYAAPGTPTEIKIAGTWKEIIRLTVAEEDIGIHDNFFDLGGTSMDVIKVNSRINREFNKQIPIVAMYKYTTIRTLAQFLDQDGTKVAAEYPENERTDKIERGKTDKNKMREMRRKGR